MFSVPNVMQWANLKLEAQSHVNAALKIGHLTREEAAEKIGASRSAVDRISNGVVAQNRDVSGLAEAVIRELYGTSSGVALTCQLTELKFRMADLENLPSKTAIGLIPQAHRELEKIADLKNDHLETVDRLAVTSLEGQIEIYSARDIQDLEGKRAHLQRASDIFAASVDEAGRVVALGELTSDADKLVSIRIGLNNYFVSWELDELDAASPPLRAKSAAKQLMDSSYLRNARKVITMIRDPRLAYQLADAAALASQPYVAANFLTDAITLTGHDATKPKLWQPEWLSAPLASDENFSLVITILEDRK